jgi:hypothetical protein
MRAPAAAQQLVEQELPAQDLELERRHVVEVVLPLAVVRRPVYQNQKCPAPPAAEGHGCSRSFCGRRTPARRRARGEASAPPRKKAGFSESETNAKTKMTEPV